MPREFALLNQFYITLDGSNASPELMMAILSVRAESSLHMPDMATLVLQDPHLKWIDDKSLEPGKTLRISAKADRSESPLFDGEIVEVEPEFLQSTQKLTVRAFDRLHRLSRGRYVRTYKNTTDSDIIQKIASEAGLSAEISPAETVHDYVLQSNETNLEFLQRRAAALGYLLYVKEKTLYCGPCRTTNGTAELKWGESLLEFRPRLTTLQQVGAVTVRGWDVENQQTIIGTANNGDSNPSVGESTVGGDLARQAFNVDSPFIVTDRPIHVQAVADTLASAVSNRYLGKFIEASGVCTGDPTIVAGSSIKVSTVGDRFSGEYVVTAAMHRYDPFDGYTTDFEVSAYTPETMIGMLTPPKQTAPLGGVVIAVVTDNDDPQGWGRVKVKFPWLSDENASDWSRIAIVGGGSERGIEFLPEINDEVLVGFEFGDPQYPFVIGGLWNGRDSPPQKSGEVVSGGQVTKRIIKSRTGHVVILDDGESDGNITIMDRDGNKIVLSCEDDSLTIEVQGDAQIKAGGNLSLSADGGNVSINASGSMSLQATEGISIDGGMSVDVQGDTINLNC